MAIPIFEEVMNGLIFSFGKGRRLLKVGTMEVDGLGGIDDDDADDDQNQDDGDEYIGDGHQDDDGDGTPDELEGKASSKSEDQSTGLLLIGGIIVIVLIIFFVRTRGKGPKSLGEIDERML